MAENVQIIAPNGQEGSMPSQNIEKALASGYTLPKGTSVSVLSPDNVEGSIPSENLGKALQQGYRYASSEATHSTPGQQVKAGLEGAAKGLTGGLSTLAETKLLGVDPADIRARREANPVTHGAGQIGGFGLLTSLMKGRNLSAPLALENALFSAGDETSKLLEEDPHQSMSSAIANIGMSAVLGKGLSKIGKEAGELWSATQASKAGQFLGEFSGRLLEHANGPELAKAASTAQKLADGLVSKGVAKAVGTATGAVAGSLAGHPVIGALIGERSLGHLAESALPVLAKRMLGTELNPTAFRQGIEYAVNVAKGEKLADSAVKGLFNPAAKALALVSPEKLKESVEDFKEDDSLDGSGELGHYLPEHAGAYGTAVGRAVTYLQSQKPNEGQQTVIGQPNQPSKMEETAYNRALSLSEQPLDALNLVKEGTITPKDMATLQAVHPELLNGLRVKVMRSLTDRLAGKESIPYKTQLGLSLFLGHPLESSTMPQNIMANQQPAQPPQTQQTQPQGLSAPKATSLNKGAASQQTPSQAREQAKLNRGNK